MNKKIIFVASLALLAAGCNPFVGKPQGGILRTTDGGVDWIFSNTIAGSQTSLSGSDISSLLFEPDDVRHILAGSYNNGLLESKDSGLSWTQILSKLGVYDVAQSPTDSKIIFAAGTLSRHGKVLKTADGAKSWQEVYNEESMDNTVRSISLNPTNSNDIVIGLASGNLIESQDNGSSWKLLINFADQINRVRWQPGGLFVLLKTNGLEKSTDNGGHFSVISSQLHSQNSFNNLLPSGQVGSFNQFAVDSTGNNLFITSDTGLFASRDGGKTWVDLLLPVKDKSVPARGVAFAPSSLSTVYASAGATIYKTTNNGDSWQTHSITTNGFINALLVNPTLPQAAYAGVFVGQ